ncbi:DEAD/DEAH box helicase family protein [Cellulomonas sp. A375-1]|uniref:restriction endonuclease n=1 Tax=Cellulomonas sp. A375-1 TaxID=1672219 RepID=UPI00069F99BE|nr:DEAD/DEAH box helicase family protein [Cellulomonas sp. A375-1]
MAAEASSSSWKFESDLAFQRQAIDAVTGLFKGQESMVSNFTVLANAGVQAGFDELSDLGVGNRLRLDDDSVLGNLHRVQGATGLVPEDSLQSMNFTVEMETGTGKTYVYLRTIYELNEKYGFTKFVIVVPSVAIKEGVETSISQLREHLGSLYGNPAMEYFQYDSGNLSRVRAFAVADSIQIMIVTVAAINKTTNNIYKNAEALGGEAAIDLIRATRPIIVVDEPQSVYGDAGFGNRKGAGRKALEEFNAMATVRYSATHPKADKANLVFRLDAIAAYDQQLVKQIEVDSLETEASGTSAYVKLIATSRSSGNFRAKIEVDPDSGTKRKTITVGVGDNLADETGLERYRHLDVENIGAGDDQWIVLSTLASRLSAGETLGDDLTAEERARQMIARTIRQHLAKEVEFAERAKAGAPKIKVLSLFFVDAVSKYRVYEDGQERLGEYARIFEEEYAKIAAESKYAILRTVKSTQEVAAEAHQGYFSIDRSKKGGDVFVETAETTDKGRQQASLAYEQIMKQKEWLTTPGTPIRFVFSHSALQEGWDNPNVFQICMLRNMGTERWRRQSIGRGLRLAMEMHPDGHLERVHGQTINRLTVIANEDYASFANGLQKELAEDLGMVFGLIAVDTLAALTFKQSDAAGASVVPLGADTAKALVQTLRDAGHVDAKGKVQDSLRELVRSEPETLLQTIAAAVPEPAVKMVFDAIRRVARPIDIKKARERRDVPLVKERLESPEFRALWDRIKHRTVYSVDVNEQTLREKLTDAIVSMPTVPRRKASWVSTRVKLDQMGVGEGSASQSRAKVEYADADDLPDILSVLADRTQLTRATLAHVLTTSGKLVQFKHNPQKFIDEVTAALATAKEELLVDGVKYEPIPASRPDDERWYSQEIFTDDDLAGYVGVDGNIIVDEHGEPKKFAKSVFESLVTDSTVERAFANQLEKESEVKLFVKLPSRFQIPTPLGGYNPDWAAVIQRDGQESLYFVVETKGTTEKSALRASERHKIDSASRHFEAVRVANSYADLAYPTHPVVSVADLGAYADVAPELMGHHRHEQVS